MNLIKASIFSLLYTFHTSTYADAHSYTAGTELGGGIINSNSPSTGSFYSSLFLERSLTAEGYTAFRLTIFYSSDFSSLLPGDRSSYYPSLKGTSVKLIHFSTLPAKFYFEQGIGFTAVNERIYSDRNKWGYGLTVSLAAGKILSVSAQSGLMIGAGTEYAATFLGAPASCFSVFIQLKYRI